MYARVIVDIVHENVAAPFTYRVPEGMALQVGQRVLAPFRRGTVEGIVLSLSEVCDYPEEKLRDIREPLDPYPAVLPQLIDLAEQMATDAHCPLAETLRLMLPAEMRGSRVRVKTQTVAALCETVADPEQAIAAQGRSHKRKMLLTLLSDRRPHPLEELKLLVNDPLPGLRALQQDGLVLLTQEELLRAPRVSEGGQQEDYPLTPDQQAVMDSLLPAVSAGQGAFLLHGVTGSGKTEVFIHLVRETLRQGKSAIILVPEIALTPQMVSWFHARFGAVAAVMHSSLSAGERYDEWRRIRRGDARVVIGARSAVFAPLEKPGLIIIDEEHESTYLSDRHPRYDTREVAAFRCRHEGAALLLASATPSVLSFARARRGDYQLLEMPRRVGERPLPQVELVDMRQELEQGNRGIFSGALQQALRRCVSAGEQAILLMNHRGFHAAVTCRRCGLTVKCPNCDVAMTLHTAERDQLLHCHYCGLTRPVPETCPACTSRQIRYLGAGTERVEQELRRMFPDTGIVRMDLDTTSGKDGHAKLLDEFRSGRARLLVGTQMIAKGLDFPRVTLVGVVMADMTLNLPDYRARERTFQLLTQVAGRAGRGALPGQVIVQTYKPEDEIIQAAAAQDYRRFFELEFARRRTGLYPPFTAICRLLVEAAQPGLARETAQRLYDSAGGLLAAHPAWGKRVVYLRLDQPSVKLLRGKARWHVLMKLVPNADSEAFCAELARLAREDQSGAEVWFEVNPTTMM